ncbi:MULTISPECIES: heme o synthase [unclassified Planococcus (in: firmicutes)]|uniref:heme o synthase n=1 Tax=unclassified Planococcus (in: firmicutes) TaxID=2662419 RepID=UPI000C328512|nr:MULTISPECIES: heme o synthase [unclassified Planococcus (in: firmicutes)]AUD15064.1 protoheme IX farnesyltransferase [Planococcus sp. MB-3u-03]PKG46996.1 protoheme IX farnesyltransferase [Planococcus sp. Urea-trap-24]PKG87875.1 protoheme IX farnesyltransferase [Planococcus sp. Urea-3u-39]PKH39102.1 protoheme IX farnesyltransferase [Planococcus sp. MB-3u-09]
MIEQTQRNLWAQVVKTGIIKSNLIPMLAGLMLALYTYQYSFIDNIVNIIFALLGTAAVIAAAGSFNNIYDRDIDSVMARTKNRPTVTGTIPLKKVVVVAVLLLGGGLALLYLAAPLASFLGFLGIFFYVIPYTMWTKRYTIWNTEVGSISGAMPPLIGWAAVGPDIWHPACWALFLILVIWQMPHFYAIAIRKHEDYAAANIPMLPVVKSRKRTYLQTNAYLILLVFSSLLFLPLSLGLTLVSLILGLFWLGLSLFGSHKRGTEVWANKMFLFSLVHMVGIYFTVIIYASVGLILTATS